MAARVIGTLAGDDTGCPAYTCSEAHESLSRLSGPLLYMTGAVRQAAQATRKALGKWGHVCRSLTPILGGPELRVRLSRLNSRSHSMVSLITRSAQTDTLLCQRCSSGHLALQQSNFTEAACCMLKAFAARLTTTCRCQSQQAWQCIHMSSLSAAAAVAYMRCLPYAKGSRCSAYRALPEEAPRHVTFLAEASRQHVAAEIWGQALTVRCSAGCSQLLLEAM